MGRAIGGTERTGKGPVGTNRPGMSTRPSAVEAGRKTSGAWIALTLGALLVALVSSSIHAAEGQQAFTDPSAAGPDFAVQGEYAGWLKSSEGNAEYWGLQVIARGDRRFDGWLLSGGLPGNGGDGRVRELLKGQTSDATTQLESPQRRVEIVGVKATVRDANGNVAGTLRKVVRESRTLGALPPGNARQLFVDQLSDELQAAKLTPDGLLDVGAITTRPVGDFRLHVEFRVPLMPSASGQARGNSGVYIQQRYEVQILDSFGLASGDNDCAALYRQQAADQNLCFPPLSWQTYDIEFRAARWDESGRKIANARITVWHNGVPVHWLREIKAKTGAGQAETPEPRPILFQNHGDPVRFRNVWIVDLNESAATSAGPTRCRFLSRWWPRRHR